MNDTNKNASEINSRHRDLNERILEDYATEIKQALTHLTTLLAACNLTPPNIDQNTINDIITICTNIENHQTETLST